MDREERSTLLRDLLKAVLKLVRDLEAALQYLTDGPPGTTLQGDLMANQQMNTGDSIIVTITDTEDATGLPATIDPGSLTASLSDTTDSAVVNADGTVTLTAGPTLATSKTITVSATVAGVASHDWVGTYDVIAPVVEPTSTTLAGTFAATGETAPPGSTATLPVDVTLANGAVLPAGSPLPAGTTYSDSTGELLNADGTPYNG